MYKYTLTLLFHIIISINLFGNESKRITVSVSPEDFLSEDKFTYYDDRISVRFNLLKPARPSDFSIYLLSGETSNKGHLSLMIDSDKDRGVVNLFYGKNWRLRKETIMVSPDIFESARIPIYIQLDIRRDNLKLKLNDSDTIEIDNAGLSVDYGYKFAIHLDTLPSLGNISHLRAPAIEHLRVEALQDSRNVDFIIWYVIIILLDVLVFAYMYNRHRKRKQDGQSDINEVSLSSPIYLNKPLLPTTSAIYLFGGMHIYNKDGEDIAKKFSPILKELLALLIVHSDKKGISADKMKSYLWADKSVASARNNRAVNLGKLRNLLSEVGEFEIKSDDGYWSIRSNDAFIDYLQYRTTLKVPGLLSRSNIELLCSITSEGNLLPEHQYEWLDELRGTVSDDIFDKFLAYAETMKESSATDLYIGIADVMFKFESINEQALSLKCRAYTSSGRHSAAKIFYDKFCDEYYQVYGERFTTSFSDILKSHS
ncbi:MAG: hypothetical protein ACRC6R_02340 [Bacteroidales bacterium]